MGNYYMLKLFRKYYKVFFALLAVVVLQSNVNSYAACPADWGAITYLGDGAGGGTYSNKYKLVCDGSSGIVNIQHPGFSSEAGVYVTYPTGISDCSVSSSIQGAGICVHLSAFTKQVTEFTITDASGVHTCYMYYEDGVGSDCDGGGGGGGDPDPDCTQILTTSMAGWTVDGGTASAGTATFNLPVAAGDPWSCQLVQNGLTLEGGKTYRAKFTISSSATRHYRFLLQNASGWAVLGQEDFTVTAGQTYNFSVDFPITSTVTGTVLYGIMLGGVAPGDPASDVVITNVSLKDHDCPDDTPLPNEAPDVTITNVTSLTSKTTVDVTITGRPTPTITGVTVDGSPVSYTYNAGKITITSVLAEGNHTVVVSASNSEGSDSDTYAFTTIDAPACLVNYTVGGNEIEVYPIYNLGTHEYTITISRVSGSNFINLQNTYINYYTDGAYGNHAITATSTSADEIVIGPFAADESPRPVFATPIYINQGGEVAYTGAQNANLDWCLIDPEPPMLTSATATCGNGSTIVLKVNSSDVTTGVAGYRVTVNGCSVKVPLAEVSNSHSGLIEVSLASCGITLGTYTATVEAYDNGGNYSAPRSVTLTSSTASISNVTATCGVQQGRSIQLNVGATGDVYSYAVTINGNTRHLVPENGKVTYTGLEPETEYAITVRAEDGCNHTVGNVNLTCSTREELPNNADYAEILTNNPFSMTTGADCASSVVGGTNLSSSTHVGYYNSISNIDGFGDLSISGVFKDFEHFSNGYFNYGGPDSIYRQYAIVSNPKVLNGNYDRRTDGVNRLIFATDVDPNGTPINAFTFKRAGLAAGEVAFEFDVEDVNSSCASNSARQIVVWFYVDGVAQNGGAPYFVDVPKGGKITFKQSATIAAGKTFSAVVGLRHMPDCVAYAFSNMKVYGCLEKAVESSVGKHTFCENSEVTLNVVGFPGVTTYEWQYYKGGSWHAMSETSQSITVDVELGTITYRARPSGAANWLAKEFSLTGQVCCTLDPNSEPIWIEDFGVVTPGTQASNSNVKNHTFGFEFIEGQNKVEDGYYVVVSNSNDANPAACAWPTDKTDHTGNTNGGFLLINVNADITPPVLIYEQTITPANGFCESTYYNLSMFASNIAPSGLPSNFIFRIYDGETEDLLAEGETGDIVDFSMSQWRNYGLSFAPENASSVIIRIYNNGVAGSGNDVVIDDISVTICKSKVTLYANPELVDRCGDPV
ncbi:MAG: hypothetical protein IJ270_07730, partial [Paludibacteraceae bacterium]|nr:hypothetical protein [Paludibacteraceae bacterium]